MSWEHFYISLLIRAFVLPGQEVFSKGDFTLREEVKTWPVLSWVDHSTDHLKVRVCSISHVQFEFWVGMKITLKAFIVKSYLEKVVNNYGSCPPIFWMRVTEQSKCPPWVWIVYCSYYEFNFMAGNPCNLAMSPHAVFQAPFTLS